MKRLALCLTALLVSLAPTSSRYAQLKKEWLSEGWKSWGIGFIKTDQWIETIYRSFSQGAGKGSTNHYHRLASGTYIYHGH